MAGPLQCGPALRRPRARAFQLGGVLGLDTRPVVRFSEVISSRRWRRCSGGDFEQVVADLAMLASWRAAQIAAWGVDREPLRDPEQGQR